MGTKFNRNTLNENKENVSLRYISTPGTLVLPNALVKFYGIIISFTVTNLQMPCSKSSTI